jgi:hypothetical protein
MPLARKSSVTAEVLVSHLRDAFARVKDAELHAFLAKCTEKALTAYATKLLKRCVATRLHCRRRRRCCCCCSRRSAGSLPRRRARTMRPRLRQRMPAASSALVSTARCVTPLSPARYERCRARRARWHPVGPVGSGRAGGACSCCCWAAAPKRESSRSACGANGDVDDARRRFCKTQLQQPRPFAPCQQPHNRKSWRVSSGSLVAH